MTIKSALKFVHLWFRKKKRCNVCYTCNTRLRKISAGERGVTLGSHLQEVGLVWHMPINKSVILGDSNCPLLFYVIDTFFVMISG